MRKTALLFLLIALTIATISYGAEMRRFHPIRTPVRVASLLPVGYEAVQRIMPVDRQRIVKAMKRFSDEWNTPETMKMLSDDFFDKSRFGDSMATTSKVPPEAELRLLSVQGAHTLRQMMGEDPTHGRLLVSIVFVTARTQIEFNDSTEGFVRLEGVNDFILVVKEKIE